MGFAVQAPRLGPRRGHVLEAEQPAQSRRERFHRARCPSCEALARESRLLPYRRAPCVDPCPKAQGPTQPRKATAWHPSGGPAFPLQDPRPRCTGYSSASRQHLPSRPSRLSPGHKTLPAVSRIPNCTPRGFNPTVHSCINSLIRPSITVIHVHSLLHPLIPPCNHSIFIAYINSVTPPTHPSMHARLPSFLPPSLPPVLPSPIHSFIPFGCLLAHFIDAFNHSFISSVTSLLSFRSFHPPMPFISFMSCITCSTSCDLASSHAHALHSRKLSSTSRQLQQIVNAVCDMPWVIGAVLRYITLRAGSALLCALSAQAPCTQAGPRGCTCRTRTPRGLATDARRLAPRSKCVRGRLGRGSSIAASVVPPSRWRRASAAAAGWL